MGALHSRPHDIPLEDTVKGLQKQIDDAAFLGLKYAMTFGTDEPAQFDHYFQSMARAAAYGAEKGVQVVMKPHGGSSGASGEIIAAVKKVGQVVDTPEATAANARANREFLERVLAAV
jgi:hypothetical protein